MNKYLKWKEWKVVRSIHEDEVEVKDEEKWKEEEMKLV